MRYIELIEAPIDNWESDPNFERNEQDLVRW